MKALATACVAPAFLSVDASAPGPSSAAFIVTAHRKPWTRRRTSRRSIGKHSASAAAGAATASATPALPPLESTVVVEEILPDGRPPLLSLSVEELASSVGGTGRARRIWEALRKGQLPIDIDDSTEKPLSHRALTRLLEATQLLPYEVINETVSACGTVKLLVRLRDGHGVETVIIPSEKGHSTLCVSSQIGCARACRFCKTGQMGLMRNLGADEILAQVFFAHRWVRESDGRTPPIRNAVFMGMGEPLNNPRAVRRAIQTMTDPFAFGLGRSHITVSTVGPSPASIRLLEDIPVHIAWSVHAARDNVRRLLVPTTVHPMTDLRDAFADMLIARSNKHQGPGRFPKRYLNIMVECTLLDGLNDSREDAEALVELVRGLPGEPKVNLLPYNDIGVPGYRRSPEAKVAAYLECVREGGVMCSVRRARGDEDMAACGQLATTAGLG